MAAESPPSRRWRLSVAMIVRDEQEFLATTLESVRPIADEILVLDTGSTDQSPTIAEQWGALVSRMPWRDDFSAARNCLLDKARGDWVLWVDAGERLTAESAPELRQFLDREADPRTVYLVMVEVPPADPRRSGEQAARPRLMPNRPDVRFTGRVRETLQPAIEAAGLEIGAAPGRIVRHPRVHDPDRKARNAQRDLKLIALEATKSSSQAPSPPTPFPASGTRGAGLGPLPESGATGTGFGIGPQADGLPPRLLIALGEASSNLDDQAAARRAFLQAVRLAPRGSTEMLEAYYGLLATFDGDPTQRARQVALCLEALEIYPLDAQLLCAMGSYLQSQNRLDLAARAFETAVKYGTVDPRTWHLCEVAEMAAAFLGLTLQMQGKDDEARRVFEKALARFVRSVRIRRHLVNLCIKQGRTDDAIRAADGIALDRQQREPLHNAIRGACKAAAKDWLAALGLLQGAYLAGCREPLCLRWLAVTLLSNGQARAAEPILHEWLQLEPDNAEVQTYLKAFGQERAEDAPSPTRSPVASEPSRRIRIDPGTTVMDVAPTRMPIIHQAFSTDTIPDANG